VAVTDVETVRPLVRRAVAPAAIAAVFLVLFFAPFGFKWPCPMRTLVGVPCPTCGMTRAARLAAHGDFVGALHMHPLWIVVLPALGIVLGVEVVGYVRTGAWGASAKIPHVKQAGYVILALLLVVWIARFFGAFSGPAPA
jgi:hypothetical protein